MQRRLNMMRNQSSNNHKCLAKYNHSNVHAQICSLLIDHFRISEESSLSIELSSVKTNECSNFGGQCIPNSLLVTSSMLFTGSDLICPIGFICWLQGKVIFFFGYE